MRSYTNTYDPATGVAARRIEAPHLLSNFDHTKSKYSETYSPENYTKIKLSGFANTHDEIMNEAERWFAQ